MVSKLSTKIRILLKETPIPQAYMCDNCGKPVSTSKEYAGTVAVSVTTGQTEEHPMQEMFAMMGQKPQPQPTLESAIFCTVKCAIAALMLKDLELSQMSIDSNVEPDNRLQYLP